MLYTIQVSYFYLRKLEDSIKYLNLSTEINKNFVPSYVTLGHIYLRLKEFNKALENYKKVLNLIQNVLEQNLIFRGAILLYQT